MVSKLRNFLSRNSAFHLRFFLTLMLLVVILFSGVAFAGRWTNYTNANEISGSAIEGNYLWLATTGGVVKWDLPLSTYIKLTTTNGLADHSVKDAFVDNGGNKWFGTIEGVQKFDGMSWTTFNTANSPLPDNRVYAIIQDTANNMWFGTGHGIACFDGVVNWQIYTDLGGGATNVAVRGIGVDSENKIWTANNPDDYGDPGGVSVFDGSSWTRHDPNTSGIGQYFLSIIVDGNDNVWAGNWTAGVYKYNGSAWENYNSSGSPLMGDQIECFDVEEDTVIWIGNHSWSAGGASRFDGTNWTNYHPGNSGIDERNIYSISIDGDDKYFGTETKGTSKFDGSTWSSYMTSNEPHCNWITSIDGDGMGNIYFGTNHYGIAIFDGATWYSYHSGNSGLGDDFVNCVSIDEGDTLWVGTQYSGLYKYDGSAWINFDTLNSGLLGNTILSIAKDTQGNLWLGTAGWDGPMEQNGALAKFDGSNWTNYYLENSGLIDDDGLNVAVDNGDTIWVGTEEGVSKYNQFANDWTNYTESNGLVDNRVTSIAIDMDNNKLFATRGGVSKFDGTNWTNYTEANGIADNEVRDIVAEADTIWIATENGVSFLNNDVWTTYRQTDSLSDNDVNAVFVDTSGKKWFGTNRSGISEFDNTGAGISETNIPAGLRITSYPNPFSDRTYIQYSVADAYTRDGYPIVKIYDTSGRLVRSINSLSSNSGVVVWDGRNETGERVASGVYVIRMQTSKGNHIATGKTIYIK